MKRLLCLAFLLVASGASAQDYPEGFIEGIQDRATLFQVLHIERVQGEGYVYYFEPSQSFEGQNAPSPMSSQSEAPALFSQGGVLTVRSTGVAKALVFVESDQGYPGLSPNALLLTEDDPVGRMETTNRDGRAGPFLSSHTIRVLVCAEPRGDECGRWIEATPPRADPSAMFYGVDLYIIEGPELGGDRQRPVDD